MQTLQLKDPKARLAEMAKALAASEMEALVCQLDYDTVVPLRTDWPLLFTRLPTLGPVMALTRNEWIVHECKGHYAPASWIGMMGLVQGRNIDLRMLASRWRYLFAVQVAHARGVLHSLQIFDESGTAVHKIYLEPGADWQEFQNLFQDLRLDAWPLPPCLAPAARLEKFRSLSTAEVQDFRRDWSQLQNTHEFAGMLRKHRVSRLQAMHLADRSQVQEVERNAVQQLLEQVQQTDEPIVAWVDNPGMIQIYSGEISTFKKIGDWLNILDPEFNLHIDTRGLHRVFVVHKPTRFGITSSLEIFSPQGELILSLFGYRKDDQGPSESWGQLLATLRRI